MRRYIFILSLLVLLLGLGATAQAQQSCPVTHVVAAGENLYRISLRYGVSVQTIAQANGIANPNLIYAGQSLTIPCPGTPPATPVPGQPTPTPPPSGEVTYTVVPGDTLGAIARRYNTTVQAIATRNGIANPNLIYPGQVLIIPTGGTPPPATPVPGVTPPPPPSGGFELGGQVFSFSYPDQMRGAGMNWAKSQIVWNQGDPASIVQGAIDAAHSRGFKVLLSIKGNPAQLAANPTQYYQNFANFLSGVAALGPEAIEVWNEQNIDREWPVGQINGANYTQMLSAAYQAIKRANPNVIVVSGAPAPTGFFGGTCQPNGCDDNVYIRQMASAGAAQFMDCVGVHYNEGIIPPSQRSGDPRGNSSHYSRYFFGMLDLYASVFPSRPICWTELGYLSPEGLGPLPPAFSWAANTSVQEQAEWLAQSAILSRNSGRVRLMVVWNVDATEYGADPQAGYAIVRGNQCVACITLGAAMGVS
jgi:LysM repeat protein